MPGRPGHASRAGQPEPPPLDLRPMLAVAADLLPADGDVYAFEPKWDGVRVIAGAVGDHTSLRGRNGTDVAHRYPELAGLHTAVAPHRAVLDGEVVAFDADGRPSFERLQRRMHVERPSPVLTAETPVTFVAFDLLWLDGDLLLEAPYRERRARLVELGLRGASWQAIESTRDGSDLFDASRTVGLEGVVAKRLDSTYRPGHRSRSWLKVKHVAHASLVVGGYLPERSGSPVGSLLLGYHDGADSAGAAVLRYAGRVGSGITRAGAASLAAAFRAVARADSPFATPLPPDADGARFTEPVLVADVAFAHWTAAKTLRHPRFRGLRDDIDPHTVTAGALFGEEREQVARASSRSGATAPTAQAIEVEGRQLRLTNLEKVLYPEAGFTKAMVVDYYARVAPHLLTHLRGRPLTLRRFPDGVDGPSFFEKHCPQHRPPWVSIAPVGDEPDDVIDYCLADDLPTLVWLANLAAIELHPSLSLASDMPRPTAIVFDLDPGPGAGIPECCRVALDIRSLLADVGLDSYVKSSGSKGLQVYTPLNTPASYQATKSLARAVAVLLEREHPRLVTSKMAKRERPGKVFIDWSQNDEHKTTVAAYSLRATPRPFVSTPVTWDEVADALRAPDATALALEAPAVLARLDDVGDLFAPVASAQQALPSLATSLPRPSEAG